DSTRGTMKVFRKSRFFAPLSVFLVLVLTRSVAGAPGDIFSVPAPAIFSDAPNARDTEPGDTGVSTNNGRLSYNYVVRVPPGRQGMQPSLALTYSSRAPIYGGIAAGWSLSLPAIGEDTSLGHLRTHSPELETAQCSARTADDRFTSSLSGNR